MLWCRKGIAPSKSQGSAFRNLPVSRDSNIDGRKSRLKFGFCCCMCKYSSISLQPQRGKIIHFKEPNLCNVNNVIHP